MLDCDGEQSLGLQLEPFPATILRLDAHLRGPLDFLAGARKAEASLFEAHLSLHRNNYRVHEDAQLTWLALGRAIHDEHLPAPSHLRRRQAHAGSPVNRLGHVIDESAEPVRALLHPSPPFASSP